MTRRLVAAVALALIAVLLPLGEAAGPANAEPPTTVGSDYVATCLQSARSLSALFLYDQSGSLSTSDPSGIRYDGLRVALKSLAAVNRGDGVPVAIEAAVAAFDDGYYPARDVVDWTRLNEGSSDDIAKTIDDIVKRAQNSTQPNAGTNFTEAMNGAWGDLKDRGARGTCRVVFWFTDGADNVDTVSNAPCMPDSGLLDQMRKAGIVVVGLQLGPQTDDLRAIATGSSASVKCGRDPIPSDWADGVYIQADDSAALRKLFGTLGNIVRGCTPQGDRGGRIDPGIRAMSVTINTPSRVTAVRLDAPDGTTVTAAPEGSTTEGGYTTVAQSDESYVSLTVDFPPGKGAGQWQVSAGQAVGPGDIEFCVFSGLHLERIDSDDRPTAGGTAEIAYHAVDSSGVEADLSEYRDAVPGAAVLAANGDIRKATAIRDGNRIVVRVDTLPIDARLQLKLTVQLTTTSDLALTPLAVDEGVGFKLNDAYPTISPIDQLDLGVARKAKTAEHGLMLVGSPKGPTKVCFEAPKNIVVPQDQVGATVDVQTGCIELARGESREVRVGVAPVVPTVGNGEAELPIKLVPVVGTEVQGQDALVNLPVLWRYENPRSQPVLWTVVVLISLISVVLPLLALGLANWITARFDVDGLRGEVIKVVIGPDGPKRVDRERFSSPTVLALDRTKLITVSGRRQFTVGPVEFVSKSHLSPFKAPTFSVRANDAEHRVLSSVPPPSADGTTAAATPGLGFFVVVVVSSRDLLNPGPRELPATIVFLNRDRKVSSAQLDPLMNGAIDWSVLTERWREGVEVTSDRRSRTTDVDDPDEDPPLRASNRFDHLDRDDDE